MYIHFLGMCESSYGLFSQETPKKSPKENPKEKIQKEKSKRKSKKKKKERTLMEPLSQLLCVHLWLCVIWDKWLCVI